MSISTQMKKNQERVEEYHAKLPDGLRQWLNQRGIPDPIINKHKIGFNGKGITIPVKDDSDAYVSFKYRRNPRLENKSSPKYWNDSGANAQLYGVENLNIPLTSIVICEGELDCLVLEGRGIPSVTSTAGAGTFKEEWVQYFKGIHEVYICLDNDEAGRSNALKIAKLINNSRIVTLPYMGEDGKDITDYFKLGNKKEDFEGLIRNSKTAEQMEIIADLEMAELQGEIIRFYPSQDIVGSNLYYTIPFYKRNTDEKSKDPYRKAFYVISGDRHISMVESVRDFDKQYGFYVSQLPSVINQDGRWSKKYINEFIKNKYTPNSYEVFELIRTMLHKYIELPDDGFYTLYALWSMGTYLFQTFESFPYLGFTGMQGSGKSKMLRILAYIAFNAQQVVNISEASLFRDIESMRSTMIIDESEELNDRKNKPALMAILNCGYSRGLSVSRQEKDSKGGFATRQFNVYSPKALGNIAGFQSVLNSRMIGIAMIRAKGKRGGVNPTDRSEDWARLRHEQYAFALTRFRDIKDVYLRRDGVISANNRSNDLWLPILSIAKVVFKDHPEEFSRFKLFAECQIKKMARDGLEESMTAFLLTLKKIVKSDCSYSIRDIKKQMSLLLEADDMQEVTSAWIGHKLKNLGLSNKRRHPDGVYHYMRKAHVDEVLSIYDNELKGSDLL